MGTELTENAWLEKILFNVRLNYFFHISLHCCSVAPVVITVMYNPFIKKPRIGWHLSVRPWYNSWGGRSSPDFETAITAVIWCCHQPPWLELVWHLIKLLEKISVIYHNSILIKSCFPNHPIICKDLPLSCIVHSPQLIFGRLIKVDYEFIRNLVFCNVFGNSLWKGTLISSLSSGKCLMCFILSLRNPFCSTKNVPFLL